MKHKTPSAVPLAQEADATPASLGPSTDIAERQRSRGILTESDRRYRTLFDAFDQLDEGFCVVQVIFDEDEKPIDYRFLEINPAFESQTGLVDARGKSMRELVPEHEDYWFEIYGEIAVSGQPARFVRRAEQLHRWLDVYAFRVGQSEDRQVAILFNDITERQRAEETLAESQRELAAIFDAAADGILLAETEGGRFRSANASICRMLGYSQDEMLDLGVSDIFRKEDVADGVREFERHAKGESALSVNLRLKKKDGSVFFADVSSAPVTLGSKRLLLGIFRDITARKRADEKQSKLEAQLRQAQKMESVGRLAGGVAHDFNNMLGVILGHAELALGHVDADHALHADLDEIRKAALRSADLTRQLLAFARKQTVMPKVLDLNEVVGSMLTMLQRLIGENIDVTWQPGAGVWSVKVDPSQIDQILANLCVNARDAISGVGRLTIETGNSTIDEGYCAAHAGCRPGEYVRLTVTDDGCGMDEETQSHLFEPFFTTKATGEGTGLGLATVYGVVKQNNGYIDVSSEPGQGTTLTIYLPRHVGKAVQARAEDAAIPARRGHETILLVEDEPSILRLTKTLLEHQGYIVLAASTPGAAIRLATEHAGAIHLLMTDVVMPEMNGRTLAKTLLAFNPHLKCLFMSGYTADVIAHHGVLDEGIQFLQKPFSTETLASKIRDALDAQH